MKPIIKIVIILIFFFSLFILSNIYINSQHQTHHFSTSTLNININFNKQNYSNSNDSIIYINTSNEGGNAFSVNEYDLYLAYIGSNLTQVRHNISDANKINDAMTGVPNKYLNTTNLYLDGEPGTLYCFNFTLSSSKPDYKETWNFTTSYYTSQTGGHPPVKVKSGYFTYCKSSIAGTSGFLGGNVTTNFPYIYVSNTSSKTYFETHIHSHISNKKKIRTVNNISNLFLAMENRRGFNERPEKTYREEKLYSDIQQRVGRTRSEGTQ